MKHLVQYHNVAAQGPLTSASSSKGARLADYFEIGTNKRLRDLRGAIVWCVSGEGSPRSYHLEYVFVVDEVVVKGSGSELSVSVRGRKGLRFSPRQPLSTAKHTLPWFGAFRRSQGNFAFGLSSIREEFVPELERFLPNGYRFK